MVRNIMSKYAFTPVGARHENHKATGRERGSSHIPQTSIGCKRASRARIFSLANFMGLDYLINFENFCLNFGISLKSKELSDIRPKILKICPASDVH